MSHRKPVAPRRPSRRPKTPYRQDSRPRIEVLEERTLLSFNFNAPIDYAVGTGPHGIISFVANGKTDLALANPGNSHTPGNTVSVLVGNGDGSFKAAVNYTVGPVPEDVRAADVNGDGKIDLVTANNGDSGPNSVSILLGNGDGTFKAAVNVNGGPNPFRVTLGDVNADGNQDIVASNRPPIGGDVTILLGNGNGTFKTSATYTIGSNPFDAAIADFNGDGKQDLVVTNGGSSTGGAGNGYNVLLGNGNGTFHTPVHFSWAANPTPDVVVSGDFNGDGKADLAIADDTNTGAVSVFLGNGNGTFAAPVNYSTAFSTTANIPTVVTGDINGDGKLDLVACDITDSQVWVLLGNGDGTFQAGVNYLTGGSASSVTVADLNGDGKADVAVADNVGNTATVLLNQGGGILAQPTLLGTNAPGAEGVAVGDFNGDGKQDVAVANYGGGIDIFLGNGDGTFASPVSNAAGTAPTQVVAADVNHDGKLDLVATDFSSGTISVLLGNGDGTFAAATNYTVGTNPAGLAVADFNGDGKLDVAATNEGSGSVSVLLGNGDGTFGAAVNYTVGTTPGRLAVGDFNGDGKPDLAVTNFGSNSISILPGNGDGTFGAGSTIAGGTAPYGIVVADFNGDGKPDLAVADAGVINYNTSAGVAIYLGNGNGTFKTPVLYDTVGRTPIDLAVANLNGGANEKDIIAANFNGNDVSIMAGNGNGTFGAPTQFVAGFLPFGVGVGDFNGDKAPDLVVPSAGLNGIAILLNQPAVTHFQVTAPASVTAGSPFTVTVTALSAFNVPVPTYTGTVHFTSSDTTAVLPANYTFTAADAGVHTFTNGFTLKKAGAQTITATDTVNASITGSASITVAAAAATHFVLTPSTRTPHVGVPFSVTVTALDRFGNVAGGYRGTVHFTSTDTAAVLPANYTFTARDRGRHTFSVTLNTQGSQSVTATDTVHATVKGSVTVTVGPAAGLVQSSLNPLNPVLLDAFFLSSQPTEKRGVYIGGR